MIDIKNIREQQSLIQDRLAKRDKSINLDNIISADLSLRELTKKLNDLQSDQNRQSKEIGILKSEGKADDSVFAKLKELSSTCHQDIRSQNLVLIFCLLGWLVENQI